jgi:hypothetical protein
VAIQVVEWRGREPTTEPLDLVRSRTHGTQPRSRLS